MTESSQLATRVLLTAFAAAVFLWAWELPIAIGAHGLLHDALGNAYVIALHATALTTASILLISLGPWQMANAKGNQQWFAAVGLAYVLIGIMPLVSSAIEPVETRFAWQQLLCGFITPILAVMAIAGLPEDRRGRLWMLFYGGWIGFLLVSFALLAWSWRMAGEAISAFADMSLAQRILAWRFTMGEPWNIYGLYMGNANKMSNYLVMFLLLSVCLLRTGTDRIQGVRRGILFSFWLLACVTLVLLFSRAALLLLPIVFVSSGIWSEMRRGARAFVVASVMAVIGGVLIFALPVFEYLLAARFLDEADAGPLGSFEYRFEQWRDLAAWFESHPANSIFGMGTSGYGMQFFGAPEAGTHNTFLDLWAESGALAPLLMFCVLLALLLQAIYRSLSGLTRRILFVGTSIILLLMFREHSVSYLYVTSLGGLCIAALMYMALTGKERSHPEPGFVRVATKEST